MPEQITRLLLFFMLVLIGYFVIRPAVIPQTYGMYGHYRAAALGDIRAREPHHTGRQECADCHEDEAGLLAQSMHAPISCETCHTAGAAHAADPAEVSMPIPETDHMRQFCGLCHHARVGRPDWMPTVDITTHMAPDPCTDCHSPHEVMEW